MYKYVYKYYLTFIGKKSSEYRTKRETKNY